jgi:hypothetical protein
MIGKYISTSLYVSEVYCNKYSLNLICFYYHRAWTSRPDFNLLYCEEYKSQYVDRCTALNVTKGLPDTWRNRVWTEQTTVTARLLTRLPTAIQMFYHQLKIISTWHIYTHTHTTNLHGGVHARQIPSIRTPHFFHTRRGRGNVSYRCWER